MSDQVAVVVPSYGHFDYVEGAIRSAYAHTPNCLVYLLDDHSPDWKPKWIEGLVREFPKLRWRRFGKNAGLTRSWNEGLRWARDSRCAHTVVTNSDVLFTPGWFDAIRWALDNGVDLAGPLTNAPGHQPKQQVRRHIPDFEINDDPENLAKTAATLAAKNRKIFTALKINGFCMVAKTATWWAGAHDATNVFDPKFRMTKNEDEIQGRWKRVGRVAAVVPGSFVFHFRGVTRKGATRGQEGRGWFRKQKPAR